MSFPRSIVKHRKELAAQTTLFAESFGGLADSEEVTVLHTGKRLLACLPDLLHSASRAPFQVESLKAAMHQMADVEVRVARLHSKQVRCNGLRWSDVALPK